MKIFRKALFIIPLGVLAGCGGPSEEDIAKTYDTNEKVVIHECVESVGKPGYTCTFSFGTNGYAYTYSFVKVGDNWQRGR